MPHTRARYPARRVAAERYPYRVDIPLPHSDFSGRLSAMYDWCRAHIGDRDWQDRAISRRGERGTRSDFWRFYFLRQPDAQKFRREWLPNA